MNISKLLITATVLFLFNCGFSQDTPQDSTQVTNPFEPRWSFGAQLQQGLAFNYYDYDGERYHGSTGYTLNLGFLANYKWHGRHALHTELNFLTGQRNSGLGANLQYEYSFSNRWSIYGGIGMEYTFPYNYVSPYLGAQRRFVPTAMLGIRYKASRWITLDLKYQRDLIKRFEVPSCPANSFRYNNYNIMMGIQVNF